MARRLDRIDDTLRDVEVIDRSRNVEKEAETSIQVVKRGISEPGFDANCVANLAQQTPA